MPPPVDATGRPTVLREVDLDRFFHPKTVVVIGASDTSRKPNTAMWAKIRAWGEANGAAVIPVNPNRDSIDGVTCHRSILDVPGDVDLAVILVGDSVTMFETVLQKKPHFAMIFAAGFAEVGEAGEALQQRLEDLIASGSTHLLGPNTNLNAFETFREDLPGPKIALITQSGHQGRPVFQAQELGIALSHWAPTGNEADLEFADFARYFTDQPEVGVIAAYIEGFKDGRTLQLAADHAARAGVPIVCVKVGRTEEGRSMARSHTGHLTGSDRVTSDVFGQYGITRVDGLDELVDVAATFARTKPPADGAGRRRVAVYAISGGTGAHMADLVSQAGLCLPDLTPETQARLHELIPPYLRVSNPIDSGGPPVSTPAGRQIIEAIVADPNIDLLICPITGAVASLSRPLATDLAAVSATTDKPILVVWGSPIEEDVYTDMLLPSGMPLFRTFANCVRAAKAWFDWHEFQERYASPFDKPVRRRSAVARRVDDLLPPGRTLAEHDSKAVLAAYGIGVTDDRLCTTAKEAVKAAGHLGGAVVMKIASADIGHKSDLGLVRLGVQGPTAVRRMFSELVATAGRAAPDASIDGVLVCQTAPSGTECVLGVSQDDLFGPTLMFGLGGVFVEVFADVAFRVPPFDKAEARRMIEQTRGSQLLAGARGGAAADKGALVDALMKLQRLAVDHADRIAELDINPLVVSRSGAVALDALIVTR